MTDHTETFDWDHPGPYVDHQIVDACRGYASASRSFEDGLERCVRKTWMDDEEYDEWDATREDEAEE